MEMAWQGWGGGPWFLVFPLFWLALAAVAIVLFRRGGPRRDDPGSAERILAERYARGEISADEYDERRTVLRKGR